MEKVPLYSIQIFKMLERNFFQNILMLFFIYYSTIFWDLYSKSQRAFFKNEILWNLNSFLYSIGFVFLELFLESLLYIIKVNVL